MKDIADFEPELTADGSLTFYSAEFGETFHSRQGARQEAELKFVEPTQLRQKAQQKPSVRLLDLCYGLGYNTAAALAAIWSVNPGCRVELLGLELDPAVPGAAIHCWRARGKETRVAACSKASESSFPWSQPLFNILATLAAQHQIQTEYLHAQLWIRDARISLQHICQTGFLADAIFLDPFSPPRCPQLWTVEFLDLVARCLQPTGRLATYSCAAAVRAALLATGLSIGSTRPVGRRSPGTVASFDPGYLSVPSEQEREHLLTRAAVPYRDPTLSDDARTILERRQLEQQHSQLEPTSHWKKRWMKSDLSRDRVKHGLIEG